MSNGIEHGVKWEIDDSKFDPVIINVESLSSGEKETVIHNCAYRPIFGYDTSDINDVEIKLDKLIEKYSNDGYKAK